MSKLLKNFIFYILTTPGKNIINMSMINKSLYRLDIIFESCHPAIKLFFLIVHLQYYRPPIQDKIRKNQFPQDQ
ncbi:hypothetical protein APB19_25605 [Pseudomonas aeruginosa]|nr:hypothetical protein APB19_25605 [Pseudomonas aeruginosa]NBK32704.1 hypothetical protein [Pseudomonas aeruginosa]NBY88554.1 hypothetical protein [Pseudomonas aeruginosa]RUI07778.1 hypothetical protein IPC449_14420 [Pseudomonas aeruginosa]RUK30308.1 hypothetical protein IPC245_09865 [Pseudomonas aeruginosa]